VQIESDEVAAIRLAAEDTASIEDRNTETDHEMALRLTREEEAAVAASAGGSGHSGTEAEPRRHWQPPPAAPPPPRVPVSGDEELAQWMHMHERQMAAARAAQQSLAQVAESDFALALRLHREERAAAEAKGSRRKQAVVGAGGREGAAVPGRMHAAAEERSGGNSAVFGRPNRRKHLTMSDCSVM
jgi:hypothetical protein